MISSNDKYHTTIRSIYRSFFLSKLKEIKVAKITILWYYSNSILNQIERIYQSCFLRKRNLATRGKFKGFSV